MNDNITMVTLGLGLPFFLLLASLLIILISYLENMKKKFKRKVKSTKLATLYFFLPDLCDYGYNILSIFSNFLQNFKVSVLRQAIHGVTPGRAVKARRVGGLTHQVPIEIGSTHRKTLAIRWLLAASRKRPGRNMALKLSSELVDAAKGSGDAIRKRIKVRIAFGRTTTRSYFSMLRNEFYLKLNRIKYLLIYINKSI